MEDIEFHHICDRQMFEKAPRSLVFKPLDGVNFELCRFRVRPRDNFELPLQVLARMNIVERSIEVGDVQFY